MTTPEHLHLALNHLPFLGAGFALVPLLIGLISGQKNTVLAGLILAVGSGCVTPLVIETGEAAYERYEHGPVSAYLDPQAERSLDIHEHRAEFWGKVIFGSALMLTIGLGLLLWKPKWVRGLAAAASVLCLISLLSGIWIAESGGPIRRPDFRSNASVPSGAETPGQTSREDDGH